MKPPKVVYLLCLATITATSIQILRIYAVNPSKTSIVSWEALIVLIALAIYFLYFAIKRVRFDLIRTNREKRYSGETEVEAGASMELCHFETHVSGKINIVLKCNKYNGDDKFRVVVLNEDRNVIGEGDFIPVFGGFSLERCQDKAKSVHILVQSSCAGSRKVFYRIVYKTLEI